MTILGSSSMGLWSSRQAEVKETPGLWGRVGTEEGGAVHREDGESGEKRNLPKEGTEEEEESNR